MDLSHNTIPSSRFFAFDRGDRWLFPVHPRPRRASLIACTSDERVAGRTHTTCVSPTRWPAPLPALANACLPGRLTPADPALVTQIARDIERFGQTTARAGDDQTLIWLTVAHERRERVYLNGCEGVTEQPSDMAAPRPTDRFRSVHYVTDELLTATAGTSPDDYFRGVALPGPIVVFGRRTAGWFEADPALAVLESGARSSDKLARLAAVHPTDPDEAIALQLTRIALALDAHQDDQARAMTRALDAAVAERGLEHLHHELREIVRDTLPAFDAIGTTYGFAACGYSP